MFDPAGINQNTMRFVEAFLIFCLLADSPFLDDDELTEIRHNHTATAKQGRDPAFRLSRHGKPTKLADWGNEILADVAAVAEVLDCGENNGSYGAAVEAMRTLVADPDATPSARIVADLEQTGSSFFEYARGMASCHRDYFASIAPLQETQQKLLEEEARESLQRQADIEATDNISLDEYLLRYFSNC
jgi:glutamate--cysteine ligase